MSSPNRQSSPQWDAVTWPPGRMAVGPSELLALFHHLPLCPDFPIHYPLFTIHCYNTFMHQTLQTLAEFTAARLLGDGNVEITTVASIAQAQPGALVFVQDEKHLAQALASPASALIAGEFAAPVRRAQAPADCGQSPAGIRAGRSAAPSAQNLCGWRSSHGCRSCFGEGRCQRRR